MAPESLPQTLTELGVDELRKKFVEAICKQQQKKGLFLASNYPELFVEWFEKLWKERLPSPQTVPGGDDRLRTYFMRRIEQLAPLGLQSPYIEGTVTGLAAIYHAQRDATGALVNPAPEPIGRLALAIGNQITDRKVYKSPGAYHTGRVVGTGLLLADGAPEDEIREIITPLVEQEIKQHLLGKPARHAQR